MYSYTIHTFLSKLNINNYKYCINRYNIIKIQRLIYRQKKKKWQNFIYFRTNQRTTYFCELFDRKLNSKLYSTHLNTFLLIDKEVQYKTHPMPRSTLKVKKTVE
jgi:hypothetical protein